MVTSPFEDNNKIMQLSKKTGGTSSALDLGPMPQLNLPGSSEPANATSQGNLKMNLGLHNKNIGNARAKKNIKQLGIPSLDLSTLKNVKDFKDWYGYSQKLENAIRLLREKNVALEAERDMKDLHIMKMEKQVETLTNQVKKYAAQYKILSEKY